MTPDVGLQRDEKPTSSTGRYAPGLSDRRCASRLRRSFGVLGELLLTAGVIVVLFTAYVLFWTGVETREVQRSLGVQFEALDGEDVADRPRAGGNGQLASSRDPTTEAYARITIPRLGDDWDWIIVQGVDEVSLSLGPGHYPSSAPPGQVGNFAVAGHRATHGEPFAHLDRVQVGDAIVVERGGQLFLYRVTETLLTAPDDTAVLLPVPGDAGAVADRAVLTLTTCHPRWGSSERLIVHGELVTSTDTQDAA